MQDSSALDKKPHEQDDIAPITPDLDASDIQNALEVQQHTVEMPPQTTEMYRRADAPEGVLMIENYLSPQLCAQLVAYADQQAVSDLHVVDYDNTTAEQVATKKDDSRITHHVHIDGIAGAVLNIFNDVYCNFLSPYFGVKFEWYERPQILRYPVGGKYHQHADSEQWLADSDTWEKVHDRDYSVLLYLNNDYEGGELALINQGVKIKPSTGMLMAFPSDHQFLHAALPTTSGIRYAIVSWAAAMGVQRVRSAPPYASVYLRQG
jgi:predicted 2-oxoglutarate/Fe(II)-dependent dioxygenase YbiX